MEDTLIFKDVNYNLTRYPTTKENSLRAWSSVELLVLEYIENRPIKSIHVFNDRFGVWNCILHSKKITTVWTHASQQKAIQQNLATNSLSDNSTYVSPIENYGPVDVALIKIPKSLDLFELFLQQIHKSASKDTRVVCGFMTKYFSSSMVKIASLFFDDVTQSRAWKKARLLILRKPKTHINYREFIHIIQRNNVVLKQYFGVFSSGGTDIGTTFLLNNFKLKDTELDVLDLASGNGVIAADLYSRNSKLNLTLVDDFNLAIASSKLNILNPNTTFICAENLKQLDGSLFDLVISNPPFHFEHENNIEISIELFKNVKYHLKEKGRFVLVANSHLNYKSHLEKIYSVVIILKTNNKFTIYECLK